MDTNTSNKKDKEFKERSETARSFATAVYIGGVVAASLMFISFILSAFPEDAYFTRTIMSIAGALVGGSMLVFPYALHNWAVTKQHRKITTVLYYIEMLIIGVNTVISFVSLLSKYTGYAAPEWVILYEPFSVASIIYTVCAWGTVFLTDPEHKEYAQSKESDEQFRQKIAELRDNFLDTEEGKATVEAAAARDILERFRVDRYTPSKTHFGKAENLAVNPDIGFVLKQATAEMAELIEKVARLEKANPTRAGE
jgi:hypothetical protein